MIDKEKVKDAFSNCIAEPKCKDCPWERCESLTEKRIRIPASLCHDVMEMLIDAPTIVPNNTMPTILPISANWISVKDKLPETEDDYLVCVKSYASDYRTITIRSFTLNLHKLDPYAFPGKRNCKPGWYWYDSVYGFTEDDRVTHWQKLPELPKEEVNESTKAERTTEENQQKRENLV